MRALEVTGSMFSSDGGQGKTNVKKFMCVVIFGAGIAARILASLISETLAKICACLLIDSVCSAQNNSRSQRGSWREPRRLG